MQGPKQVIVLRKDLNMRKGKMVSQGAHASMAAILNLGHYAGDNFYLNMGNLPDVKDWLTGAFTKITVSVPNEEEIEAIYAKAKELGLPCSRIVDSGKTEFNGVPTLTAVAVGPGDAAVIDSITGHLPLL